MSKKNYRKKVDFSSIKIRSKKVPRKDIDISYAEIMPKNVRQIGVSYWPIEIHRKSTSFGNSLIFFAKYWHAINSQSTSIWCDVVSIGFEKKKKFYSNLEKMCVQVFFSLGIVNANNANDYKVRFRAHCYVPIFRKFMHPCVILVMLAAGKPDRKENKFI